MHKKSGYTYFIGFIWALMLIPGRKHVTDITNACFVIDKYVSSFERFLSEYKWCMNGVIASLVSLLLSQLGERENISVHIYGKDCQVAAVVRDFWLRNIPKKVRVVVIEGTKEPVILVCTDLSLTVAQIIEIYAARFALEITIQDLKRHFGFTDYQSTTSIAIFRFVQLCCTAFCIWKLMLLPENASTWLDDVKPKAIKESHACSVKQPIVPSTSLV